MEDKRNITLFIDKRPQGIIQPSTRTFSDINKTDFYITVNLSRKAKLFEDYIDVFKDSTRFKIERQEINPYYIELGFFSTINKIEVDESSYEAKKTSLKSKAELNNITINS
jgi:hypothetical protein